MQYCESRSSLEEVVGVDILAVQLFAQPDRIIEGGGGGAGVGVTGIDFLKMGPFSPKSSKKINSLKQKNNPTNLESKSEKN